MTLELEFHDAIVGLGLRAQREIKYNARYFIDMRGVY